MFLNSKDEQFRMAFNLSPTEMIVHSSAADKRTSTEKLRGTLFMGRKVLAFSASGSRKAIPYVRIKTASATEGVLMVTLKGAHSPRCYVLPESDLENFASLLLYLVRYAKKTSREKQPSPRKDPQAPLIGIPFTSLFKPWRRPEPDHPQMQRLTHDVNHYIKKYEMTEADWDVLTKNSQKFSISAGSLVSEPVRVFRIMSGRCLVSLLSSNGEVYHSVVGPGHCIGINSLINIPLTVRAETDLVIIVIDSQTLLVRFSLDPSLGARFFHYFFKWTHDRIFGSELFKSTSSSSLSAWNST